MPMNHLTSSDIPQSIWWNQPPPFMDPLPQSPLLVSHHHRSNTTPPPFSGQNPSPNFNLNQFDDEIPEPLDDDQREERRINQLYEPADKEPMFEKPLTPSDVGKLNRLVIPKQHAEKYFPLSVDSGLLLSFEDESGKFWRFRYSYWNSSQSYVLTKGWSRFVKEKRLDAGDVVLFERHRVDGDRLFIGWRRRPAAAGGGGGGLAAEGSQLSAAAAAVAGSGGWSQVFYSAHAYPVHPSPHGASTPYQPDRLHAGGAGDVQNQTTPSGNSSKRLLRLFGVNMECQQPDESEPSTPDGSSTSSQGQAPHFQNCINPLNTPNPQRDMMDINFSRGVNQRRYHQG